MGGTGGAFARSRRLMVRRSTSVVTLALASCAPQTSRPPTRTASAPALASPPDSQEANEEHCPVKARWSLRLRRDSGLYEAEWNQCAKAVQDPVGDWDIDTLTVRDPANRGAAVWSVTNADEPTEKWLEDVRPIRFGSHGEEQLFVLTRIAGTGHAWELCVLGALGKGVGCWPLPERALSKRFDALLAHGEGAHNCQVSLRARGLAYMCGIARPGDANCCPTGGTLRATAVSADESFALTRVWRTAED
jgi:hypothetical protein